MESVPHYLKKTGARTGGSSTDQALGPNADDALWAIPMPNVRTNTRQGMWKDERNTFSEKNCHHREYTQYYKHYCKILSKVIKEAKRMTIDERIVK